jgi:hypothetical protein
LFDVIPGNAAAISIPVLSPAAFVPGQVDPEILQTVPFPRAMKWALRPR